MSIEQIHLPIALDDVDKIICCSVRLSNSYIRIAYPVLAQDGFDFILVDVREGDCVCDSYTAFVFLANSNIWGLLVQTDSEPLQFRLDNLLVAKRF